MHKKYRIFGRTKITKGKLWALADEEKIVLTITSADGRWLVHIEETNDEPSKANDELQHNQ